MRVPVDAADLAKLEPDRISRKNTVRIIRSRVWKPEHFPLVHNNHCLLLLAEVIDELNPERRDRSYPRVIKRKMSNSPVKRARHRQRRQDSRSSRSAVAITPPNKTGHQRRPAKTT
jgi:BRCT domain type II-containing protein